MALNRDEQKRASSPENFSLQSKMQEWTQKTGVSFDYSLGHLYDRLESAQNNGVYFGPSGAEAIRNPSKLDNTTIASIGVALLERYYPRFTDEQLRKQLQGIGNVLYRVQTDHLLESSYYKDYSEQKNLIVKVLTLAAEKIVTILSQENSEKQLVDLAAFSQDYFSISLNTFRNMEEFASSSQKPTYDQVIKDMTELSQILQQSRQRISRKTLFQFMDQLESSIQLSLDGSIQYDARQFAIARRMVREW
ncbi:hypothetical protein LRY65_02650 [Candidatus Woesebacteria bacterium]|nr:hypothetical protein [Candidatus Woesebacteria bacterium]